jgi:hypothetical protein
MRGLKISQMTGQFQAWFSACMDYISDLSKRPSIDDYDFNVGGCELVGV